ncbi:hypothetical protein QTI66_30850 [Variovorax sp. J22R133]|uniref:hypothetical protein n=1 Tax=Variovorax brevis TaxID=3053503 RepID=UPI00257654BC|nr:hypothetical protein [Variovorax sp. J22R133]MDM0116548.1 hypothetical protein [Variovorax sp. J22R133]
MFRRRAHSSISRCVTALVVMLSLLFSQAALAGYECPGMKDAAVMADMMASGQPCEGMDTAQPVLCHQHSAAAPLSLEPLKVPTPSLPAIVQVLIVPLVSIAQGPGFSPAAGVEPRPPPDPVFLATRRLRV